MKHLSHTKSLIVLFVLLFSASNWISSHAEVPPASSRSWESSASQKLREFEKELTSSEAAVSQSLVLATEAIEKRSSSILHQSLSVAVRRANKEGVSQILTLAKANREIRLGLLPWIKNLHAQADIKSDVLLLVQSLALEPEAKDIEGEGLFQERAVNLIAELEKDKVQLRRFLLPVASMVLPTRATHAAAERVSPYVEKADLAELRELVIHSLEEFPDQPWHPGLEILSYQGDLMSLQHLQDVLGKDGIGPNVRAAIQRHIWQIEIQNPPEELLEAIRDGLPGANRGWMVERAVGLGLPKSEIRHAVFDYFKMKSDPDEAEWIYQRPHLVEASRRFGVLSAQEIETIPAARAQPGRQMNEGC